MKYLVLEDEPLIAMDLQFALEDAGYEAVTASNNAQALSLIEQGGVAGAILDVSLGPNETCYETADRLQDAGIPFLLHTGDLNRIGEHLREMNAPVLEKPRPADDVIGALLGMEEQRKAG
ncbi:response regulator [Erythrobacteraceae bacterium WH01K]|nr:response regulator [Erythrobacteraceae bacterium WH01K]